MERQERKYVDLGLPSGTKWATCNIGATSPDEHGDYFAWGETEPKEEYVQENYILEDVNIEDFSWNQQYDAATVNWGEEWRMPSAEECQELIDECKWQWTTLNGVNGYKVIGPNGNYIFLPTTGYREWTSLRNLDGEGSYWSSSPSSTAVQGLYMKNGCQMFGFYPYYGHCIRPVRVERTKISHPVKAEEPEYEHVDLGLPSGTKWASCNVGAENPEEYGDHITWNNATTANWGEGWRMPTKEEFQELANECTWQWITLNAVTGYKVTGPNGNHIFIPAAGYRRFIFSGANECGFYWSSTPGDDGIVGDGVYCLYINSNYYSIGYDDRCDKQSIRLVKKQ